MSRTLVAGIGNIFLGDDGFGSVVARHLAQTPLPPDVEVADIGIRGVHLAYQLLDGYDTLVLVDAMPRGEEAGTVTVLETSLADHAAGNGGPPVDPHGMGPDAVLRLLAGLAEPLGAAVRRILVVGCEPATVADGIGLSDQVAAAVPTAVTTVLDLLAAPVGNVPEFDRVTTAPRESECTR
jgi:hydrogenase maturation protease